MTFTANMIVNSIKENNGVYAFKRSLLPFLCSRKDFICYAAYCRMNSEKDLIKHPLFSLFLKMDILMTML